MSLWLANVVAAPDPPAHDEDDSGPEPEPEWEPDPPAEPAPAVQPDLAYVEDITPLPCYGGLGNYTIPVHPDRITTVFLDSAAQPFQVRPSRPRASGVQTLRERGFMVKQDSGFGNKRLTMFPLSSTSVNARLQFRVVTASCQASVTLRRVARAQDAINMAKSVVLPAEQREKDRAARQQAIGAADLRSRVKHHPKAIKPARVEVVSPSGYEVLPHIAHGWWDGKAFFLAFDLENRAAEPRDVATVEIRDPNGDPYLVDIQHIEAFDIPVSRSLSIQARPAALLPGRTSGRGFISLPHPSKDEVDHLQLVLLDRSGTVLSYAQVDDWTEEERRERARLLVRDFDEEARRKRIADARYELDEAARDRVTVFLEGMGGLLWLDDGQGGVRTDAASMYGYGARIMYGYNRYVALEGAGMYGTSGESRFDNVTMEGETGSLARSATFFNLQVGAAARFGIQRILNVRGGVGLQLGSVGGVFSPAAGGTRELDSSLDLLTLWYFSVGFDYRVNDHLLLGVAATREGAFETKARTLQLGAYLGYSWKLETEPATK